MIKTKRKSVGRRDMDGREWCYAGMTLDRRRRRYGTCGSDNRELGLKCALGSCGSGDSVVLRVLLGYERHFKDTDDLKRCQRKRNEMKRNTVGSFYISVAFQTKLDPFNDLFRLGMDQMGLHVDRKFSKGRGLRVALQNKNRLEEQREKAGRTTQIAWIC